MKRLLSWIALCTLMFSVLIPFAGALGKTAPPPEFAKWFANPDGSLCPMPCLFGIRPGVTKWEEVDRILKAYPHLNSLRLDQHTYAVARPTTKWYFHVSESYLELAVYLNKDEIVEFMDLSFSNSDDPIANLGYMLTIFGNPQRVLLFSDENRDTFGYIDRLMMISTYNEFICDNFIPTSQIFVISIYSHQYFVDLFDSLITKHLWIDLNRREYLDSYNKNICSS